jgi:hypothetical protein
VQQNLVHLLMGSARALVLSAAARALPAPTDSGSRFYAWSYQFAHLLLGNFDKVQLAIDVQQPFT